MRFKVIVATSLDNGIGYENKLPWMIKEDLKEFAKTTIGNGNNAVLMGKNTWNSIPKTPLKNRTNIIVSSTLKSDIESNTSTQIYDSIQSFLNNNNYYRDIEECWIIGGERIYRSFLTEYIHLVDEIHITRINKKYECDTYFIKMPECAKLIESTNMICNDETTNQHVCVTKEIYSLK